MFVDQRTEQVHVPLNALSVDNKLELANSSLSEMAVLGVHFHGTQKHDRSINLIITPSF